MFTGIIEEIGKVSSIQKREGGFSISLEAEKVAAGLAQGESVNVNGACLTVVGVAKGRGFSVEVVAETLEKTNLVFLRPGDRVNLERSLRLGEGLSGHLVLGHVDAMGEVTGLRQAGLEKVLSLELPRELMRYVALKGSIAVDGVSLTVSQLLDSGVGISLIPFTLRCTIAGSYAPGRKVNIEIDVIARYLERLLSGNESRQEGKSRKGITLDFLKEKWL